MSRRRCSSEPTRTCVGCGSRDRQAAMVRLRHHDGGLVVAAGRSDGRSAYVHACPQCLRGLDRSKLLGRSLRAAVGRERRTELIEVLDAQLSSGALVMSCHRHGVRSRV